MVCKAVTPDEAARSLIEWTEKLDMGKSGEYWAPRGPRKYPPWLARNVLM